jgi:hypothetical protein
METLFLRQSDHYYVIDRIQNGECCSVVGLSNTGKSRLLRQLADSRTANLVAAAGEPAFIYVDCNLMLAATDQGFYEAVLRALREKLADQEQYASSGLMTELTAYYEKTVQPGSAFLIPLGFNDAIGRICQTLPGSLVLLLDEFDEAFTALDSRVFLNLRALHDKFRNRLAYVTATVQPLRAVRCDSTIEEFCELFSHHEKHLGMFTRPDANALALSLAGKAGVKLDQDELDFVWRQSGGHPGLVEVVAELLVQLEAGAPELYRQQGLELVAQRLDRSEIAQAECVKLWHQLSQQEQSGLLLFSSEGLGALTQPVLLSLQEKEIVTRGEQPQFFGERFAAHVRRRRRSELDYPEGIWLDADAGSVWVGGREVTSLSELEHRLLQTLYGRLDKLCDKYLLVESVWGQEYIDSVDDARIEKLVSRLRGKIELEADQPRYLVTVRGRGYKLLQNPSPG